MALFRWTWLLAVGQVLAIARDVAEQAQMTVPQLIAYWGYPVEVVEATTRDGYVLSLHRIPRGRGAEAAARRPAVLLQHGLESSSTNWVGNLPGQSAAFVLADHGFDVWLGNMRGNLYSRRHVRLRTDQHEFWRFSLDQMVQHDLDAMVDTILERTNRSSLYYVGHSQGTLTMFAKLGEDPAFHPKWLGAGDIAGLQIARFFALAPVGTVRHIGGLLGVLAHTPLYDMVRAGALLLGDGGQFMPNTRLTRLLATAVCGASRVAEALCGDVTFLIAGPESRQLNATRLPVMLASGPAGTSVRNVLHWAQMARSGRLRRYDFGSARDNLRHYASREPPAYRVRVGDTPVHLFWSGADWLADRRDIADFLLPRLANATFVENVELKDFNHLDFVYGLRATAEIYYPIMNTIRSDFGLPPLDPNTK